MQTEITQTIIQKIPLLSAHEQQQILESVETFLGDKKPNKGNLSLPDEEADGQQKYHRQMAWLKGNQKRYGGQYVVLDGDRLLGTAKNYPDGRKIATAAGVPDAFVNYLSKPDEEGYMGGWECPSI